MNTHSLSVVRALAILTLGVITGGCASHATTPAPAAKTPLQPVVGAASSAAKAPAAQGGDQAVAVNPEYLRQGFRPAHYKGQLMYCRSESTTGTTFQHKVCLTEEQLKERVERSRNVQDELNRNRVGPGCMGPCS